MIEIPVWLSNLLFIATIVVAWNASLETHS